MRSPDDTIRVFIALDIPLEARQVLSATMQQLQTALPNGVRWVDPAGIHLTLKFLGNIDASLVNDVFEAMRQSAHSVVSFQLWLSRLGTFPNVRQPRVLWAGVDGDMDTLNHLQKRVDETVSALGFPPERQPFHPHLTLGRVRDGISPAVRSQIGTTMSSTPLASPPGLLSIRDGEEVGGEAKEVLQGSFPWPVEELHLIRSTLTPGGAVYTSLGSVPLWKP